VAVNYKAEGKCELHVLDAVTGGLLKNIESSEINVFTDPKFINDSSIVACARFRDGQMSLVRADISGSIRDLHLLLIMSLGSLMFKMTKFISLHLLMVMMRYLCCS
jgi:hypothetical protein